MNAPPFEFAREHYPLAPHTFYRIGGPARWALLPGNLEETKASYAWVLEQGTPFLVMGAGTNMLIDDRGFPGVVLFTTEIKHVEPCGSDRFRVGAGLPLADIVRTLMLPNNYAGVGALTGIPGSLGGALFMNAGTVNGSICQITEKVTLLRPSGPVDVTMAPELYGYRGQAFCGPEDLIAEATLAFTPSGKDESAIHRHYMQRRQDTQPQGWCCGSVFKNPPNDHAGRLIEACGLKGTRRGGAIISEKHANFIMNEHDATFDDVMGLIRLVKDTVQARYGIALHEEVRIISPEGATEELPA